MVLLSENGAKSRQDTSKMSFVPYGFLYKGKPVEGYLKKAQNSFYDKITHFSNLMEFEQHHANILARC